MVRLLNCLSNLQLSVCIYIVAALLSILEDPDGKVSLINNGEVSSFFATTTGGSYATIPSAVQQVPLHIVANNEVLN